MRDPVCRVKLDRRLLQVKHPRTKTVVYNKATGTPKRYMKYERQTFPQKYQNLHPDAQLLDRQLFQMLQIIAKGSLVSVISQRTGQYACYTFGIIAIWRHRRLSSATRKLSAMTRMQELQ